MPRTIRMRTRKCITFISVKHWPVPDKRARHIRQCQAGFLFCLHISQFHSNLECNTILPSGTSTDACHLRRNPPTHTIRCNRMQSLFGNKPAQFENTSNKHCVCVLWIFGTSKPTLTTQNTTSEFWKHCRHLPQHNLHNPHTVNKKLYCLSLLNIIGSKSFPFYLCLRWRLTVMCSNVDGLHTSQMTR